MLDWTRIHINNDMAGAHEVSKLLAHKPPCSHYVEKSHIKEKPQKSNTIRQMIIGGLICILMGMIWGVLELKIKHNYCNVNTIEVH